MSPFGLKFAHMILHTETSKPIENLPSTSNMTTLFVNYGKAE